MMIVRLKGNASVETQEVVRERIKEQISEGLVVHDDSVEITFADEPQDINKRTCLECGSEMDEIKAYADNEVVDVMYTCPFCEPQHD